MKLLGYDKNKNVKLLDLPVRIVVDEGIDPWRIDLFDSNPVSLKVGRKQYFFRRLRDVSFAYWGEGNALIIGVHDSERTACLTGDEVRDEYPAKICKNVRLCPGSFQTHFEQFLLQSPDHTYLQAGTAAAVHVQGGTVRFSVDDDKERDTNLYPFTGEMFELITTVRTLPEKVNDVHRELADFEPIVIGTAITDLLSGRKRKELLEVDLGQVTARVDLVQVLIKQSQFEAVASRLQGRNVGNDTHPMFEMDGVVYSIDARPDTPLSTLAKDPENNSVYTPQMLFSPGPNQLSGSRIAFYDAGRKQARKLFDFGRYEPIASGDPCRERLEEVGYKIIETPRAKRR